MALELDKKLKARLAEILKKSLPSMMVKNGWFIDRASVSSLLLGDSAIPSQGSTREKLEKYIGEFPFTDYVLSDLTKLLRYAVDYIPGDELSPIGDLVPSLNSDSSLEVIVDSFDRLPWTYTFSFRLPSQLSQFLEKDQTEFVFSKSVRIVRLPGNLAEQFPLSSGDERIDKSIHQTNFLGLDPDPQWDDALYLQIVVPGFINVYGTTETANEAISILKAFFGICLSLRVFKHEYFYSPLPLKENYYVHRSTKKNGWVIDSKLELEDNLRSMISRISFEDIPGSDIDPGRIHKFIEMNVPYINSVLEYREASGERIATACQWLFESYYGDNELLNFVQATVVLEILLGDKAASDEIGLGELLRSRCAYLIGTTRQQRDDILRDFKEIYKVRSQIVHRGKRHLRSTERRLFWLLVWMGQRVIQEEAKLLSKDVHGGKLLDLL